MSITDPQPYRASIPWEEYCDKCDEADWLADQITTICAAARVAARRCDATVGLARTTALLEAIADHDICDDCSSIKLAQRALQRCPCGHTTVGEEE